MIELFNSFASGLFQIFTWSTFSLMLVGIAIGFIVGILPGLGGPATIALMLPFIVKMSPVEAFAILLGMASVLALQETLRQCSLACPENPPQQPLSSTAMQWPRRRSRTRTGSSADELARGRHFGALVLALSVPVIRPLVLTFGSPELFMLAILGLTFVVP